MVTVKDREGKGCCVSHGAIPTLFYTQKKYAIPDRTVGNLVEI